MYMSGGSWSSTNRNVQEIESEISLLVGLQEESCGFLVVAFTNGELDRTRNSNISF